MSPACRRTYFLPPKFTLAILVSHLKKSLSPVSIASIELEIEISRGGREERSKHMALLNSLVSMLDKRCGGIAAALGEPEEVVSRGLKSSIAAVLGGLASKSEDPTALRKILDLAPGVSGDALWSQIGSGVASETWNARKSVGSMGKAGSS